MIIGIIIGHAFASYAPPVATVAVERTLEKRYIKSYEIAEPVVEKPSQWAFLNNFLVIFVMAYGGLVLSYINLGPEWGAFYRVMSKIDSAYKKCTYRDELFSLQLMPYGGSFLNGLLVGYIAKKADVSFLTHVPTEVLGLLLAALIGEKIEAELRNQSKAEFKRRRSRIVKSFKYSTSFVVSICLMAASAAVEFW